MRNVTTSGVPLGSHVVALPSVTYDVDVAEYATLPSAFSGGVRIGRVAYLDELQRSGKDIRGEPCDGWNGCGCSQQCA